MNDQQLDVLLRAANPAVGLLERPAPTDVLDDIVAGRWTGPADELLFDPGPAHDDDTGEVAAVVPLRRRRRALALLAAALVAGVVGFVLVTSREADPVDSVGCFEEPSTGADAAVIRADGLSAGVEECRELWRSGEMDEEVPDERPVPDLVPCVLDSGAVGVFPATSCDDIDRAPPPASSTASEPHPDASSDPGTPGVGLPHPDLVPDDADLAEVIETLRVTLLEECLPAEEARRMVEDVLEAAELTEWTVEIVGEHEPGHCATFAPDLEAKRIDLPPY